MTANDICGQYHTGDPSPGYLGNWTDSHDQLLQNITSSWKNVYVNLITTFNMSAVAEIERHYEHCAIRHKISSHECDPIGHGTNAELAYFTGVIDIFNTALHELTQKWN